VDTATGPLAVLAVDRALDEEPEIVEAAVVAARLAIENDQLHSELRAQLTQLQGATARLAQAAETERRRIERDLHDGAQQRLLAVSIALASAAQADRTTSPDAARQVFAAAGQQLHQAIHELRELARGIHPVILSQGGLAPALQALAARATVPVEVRCADDRYPEVVEAAAYYIVAEAVTNAMRHARASVIRVDVTTDGDEVVVEIVDDGVGGATMDAGSGLRGLADRATAVGGRLTVHSTPGRGTAVIARLPCA
jgi:signal transduction histidine kinase